MMQGLRSANVLLRDGSDTAASVAIDHPPVYLQKRQVEERRANDSAFPPIASIRPSHRHRSCGPFSEIMVLSNTVRRGWQTACSSRFRGDAAWTDSPAVACAAMSELWRRDSHTGSAFVIVSTAASIMGPFFTLPRSWSGQGR